ncbi:MAG: hypothetical protein A3C30_03155 [Candidatus Levybacteria bacterium RIFCSPHIGHO2_02_FULL_40_18]|nr:MAG: hypothetical protein A2869_04905 [Candidatus Levybacteria bacterium RIFCSPHIGHO2_01_FULL_40_58]OGH26551.1 MAG: hypothetical protein A3C30_03155 [Candidatus Levybacteria bacterium RIFCSPHIGHO2_02_FULL_40_18]OGH31540.1 MAG: hypothetical protein A3E43_02245 [Candidatus Levybacteria bacterium RIFCSPHIGHO2_12_FULL_40_31]OGH40304.1 MAG: hypothetical protein A2894_00795 [Candidatus Levybacteria bacterium RIFCSPLOWO2_01_FULL_40_64]OGH49508.1 MAG: hypothetical protein A3I54_03205 [Candidatus Lev
MVTPLCKLALKYGTDKCPQLKHSYTPFYYQLLKDKRREIKKVLEMGIGFFPGMPEKKVFFDPGLKRTYHMGASLYMWRDFFPNAQIFGADDHPETLFEDNRIQTFLCDETKKEDIVELVKKTGTDIDLFIDDANHNSRKQIFLAKNLMPLLKKDVIYIIEDVYYPDNILNALSEYDCQISQFPPKLQEDRLIVVRHKR